MTARELSQAAVEAVRIAVRRAEQEGHQHRLTDRVSLGMSEMVELRKPERRHRLASRAVSGRPKNMPGAKQ